MTLLEAMRALSRFADVRIIYDGRGLATAVVTGELDSACVPSLAALLCEAVEIASGGVELDLTDVTFCDAGTIRALLAVRTFARDRGRRFAVGPHSGVVAQLLELTDTRSLLTRPAKASDRVQADSAQAQGSCF
jgi:anti-sigma B factor antagonist